MTCGETFRIRCENPIPALRHVRESGVYIRFHHMLCGFFQEKADHLRLELLQDRDSRRGVGLDGKKECFGWDVGTHNERNYIIARPDRQERKLAYGKEANMRDVHTVGM